MVKFTTGGRIFGMPWWLAVTLLFVAGRLVSTGILLWFAAHQQENPWTDAHPSIWEFSSIWDGRWYNIIAEVGYPTTLPRDPSGHVIENAWAFLPLYPMTVKTVMLLTGLTWDIAAVGVSVVCAFVATLVFYRLMVQVLSAGTAFFATLLFSLAPVSAIYQVAYAESMQLMLIAVALLLLLKRRYLSIIPVVLLLGITRPGSLALALTLGLHILYRLWGSRRSSFSVGERWRAGIATLVTLVAGFEWMFIAGLVTGVPNAYVQTELAWRAPYVGWKELFPFAPWIEASQWWFPGVMGWVVLGVALAVIILIVLNPFARRIGADLTLWNVSYSLYILAVFFPQSSTFRILAPLFPALGAFAVPRSKIYRVALVVAFVAMQWMWVHFMWGVITPDWSPP
jgi:hypothetical protein